MRRRRFSLCALVVALLAGFAQPAASAEMPYQALAQRLVGPDQGVFVVAEDGAVLASVEADRPVHPASVTKIATTLALLQELGPEHRFATVVRGPPLEGDRVPGDLVVSASGNPYFLPESAALILAELDALGLRRVDGGLRIEGPLVYDWKPDPGGYRLKVAWAGGLSTKVREKVVRSRAPVASTRTAIPRGIAFADEQRREKPAADLLVHRSPTLVRILKELNGYSNNILHPFADRVGGTEGVEQRARESVASRLASEIKVTNAAGAGRTNRLSPRAAVALTQALDRELESHGLTLPDVLPVAGRDRGTLAERLDEADIRGAVVGKTGTYGSLGASALAGAVRTRRHGLVTFAILNRGVPVLEARRRQDAFLAAFLSQAGAVPWSYEPRPSPSLVEETVERSSPGG